MKKAITTRPTHIEVSDHFYHDAYDLSERFKYCWDAEFPAFDAVKSKRFKLFIDLRIALESSLKAVVAYRLHNNLSGELLIKTIRSYGHDIEKLKNAAINYIPKESTEWLDNIAAQSKLLPISLRYKLDAFDFKLADSDFYYSTIGSDHWIDMFYENTIFINNHIGSALSKESRILSVRDIIEIIKQPAHNTYLVSKK
jgi:hypothetical protein